MGYNTLGFNKELIDYIEFVGDSFVEEIILPLCKKGDKLSLLRLFVRNLLTFRDR